MTDLPLGGRRRAKYLAKALLGLAMETALSGESTCPAVRVSSPWDAWWACYRARCPLGRLNATITMPEQVCRLCARDALALASACPPEHPDLHLRGSECGQARSCGCLLEWAVRMRAPADTMLWPPLSLTLALLKPGAPHQEIRTQLQQTHQVLRAVNRTLSVEDTRRLYPEAYGADYLADRDLYLTQAPVTVLVMRTVSVLSGEDLARIKAKIRAATGAGELRNHLHMPDNPGEALADIAHLAGKETLAELYERHERDRRDDRLAFYRAALGVREADSHRDPAAP